MAAQDRPAISHENADSVKALPETFQEEKATYLKHACPNIHFLKVGQKSPENTQEAVIPAIVYYYRYLFRHFAVSRMLTQDVNHPNSTTCRYPSQGCFGRQTTQSKAEK